MIYDGDCSPRGLIVSTTPTRTPMGRGLSSGDMKAVTYCITPESGCYGRIGRFFREHGVWLVSVRDLDQLRDGSVVMQFDIAETPERLRALFGRDRDWVHDYQLAPGEQHPTLQLHYEPAGVTREMLELHRSHALLLDMPIEVADPVAQSLRVTEVGREAELQQLVEATRERIDVTIEQVGEYRSVTGQAMDELTDRQRQVLGQAVELGYYDEPRNVTHADIARTLDCSASAVGQHLRRAEQTVMTNVVSPADATGRSSP